MSATVVPLNPFSDQIVTSPRRAEPPVRGLNDQVLRRLVSEFEKVEALPRRCGRVQLVVSPAGGYGKSHLTGRLFHDLGRRATRIYVRPFSDPEGCWVSLLHTIVQELTGPEFDDGTDRGKFPPTQLDAFAHGVFGSLLVGLMDAGDFIYNDPNFVRERLLKRAFEKWDLSNPQSNWGVWASEMLDSYETRESRNARVTKLLHETTGGALSATTRPQAWLRVLRRYAHDRADEATRDMVLEWLRARTPREIDATKPIGLHVTDGVDAGLGPAARNALARARVLDILALARLFRPFVLCFDQTEVFGRVPGLARAFGSLLSDLVQGEGAHLTVVTANNDVWESQLVHSFERADRDRIAPRLEMLGLTSEQGRELAVQRLKQTRLPADLQDQVLAPAWLEEQFNIGLLSPREFLRRCERRYEDVVPSAPAQPAKPEMMLVELFTHERKALLADPRELADYRYDVLRWALLDVPSRMATGVTAAVSRMDVPAFAAEWTDKADRKWFIVLEEGTNALTWRAITRRASKLRDEDAKASTLVLRIKDQMEIPQSSWSAVRPEMEAAQKSGAMLIATLDHDVLSRIYATWELYTQACQGDIPHEPDSVLRFAAQRLQAWYASLRGEKTADQVHEPLMTEEPPVETIKAEAPAMPAAAPAPAIPAPVAPTVAPAAPATLPKPPKLLSTPAQPSIPAPAAVTQAVKAEPSPTADAAKVEVAETSPTVAVVAEKVQTAPKEDTAASVAEPSPKVDAAKVEAAETSPKATAASAVGAGENAQPSPKVDASPAVESANGASAPADLGDILRHLIRIRRFVSFAEISDELRTKMSREITIDEATAAAEGTGDIRVYAQGGNAGFLWQGW